MLEIIATPPKKDDVLFDVEFGLKETMQSKSGILHLGPKVVNTLK